MKQILKKTALLTLALLTVLSLLFTSACGSKKDDTPTPTPPAEQRKDGSIGRSEFIDEIGGVSETYAGSVSEEAYSSSAEAAEAFVTYELAGSDIATVTNTESKELSTSEIAASGIPNDILEGSDSVEEIEVTYLLSEDGVETYSAAKLDAERNVTVYVIKYGAIWKYFAPLPTEGAALTRSYYFSVFDSERYNNFTFEYSEETDHSTDVNGYNMVSASKSLIGTDKYADGKMYSVQTDESSTTQNGSTTEAENTSYVYIEKTESEFNCYIKNGNDEKFEKTSEYSKLEDFHKEIISIGENSEYTYFVKTDYGFALKKEKEKEFGKKILRAWGAEELLDSRLWIGEMNIEISLEYYVSNGILAGVRMNFQFGGDVNGFYVLNKRDASVKAIYDFTFIMKLTDYGTTVVERPF